MWQWVARGNIQQIQLHSPDGTVFALQVQAASSRVIFWTLPLATHSHTHHHHRHPFHFALSKCKYLVAKQHQTTIFALHHKCEQVLQTSVVLTPSCLAFTQQMKGKTAKT